MAERSTISWVFDIISPFAYLAFHDLARLLARPSFRRVIAEARPYFKFFPFKDDMPAHLLEAGA